MSVEMILYPESASKSELEDVLILNGFEPCTHLWDWPEGSVHYSWFDTDEFKSTTGVEGTVYPVTDNDESRASTGAQWALHTCTRASASTFDRTKQNMTIRFAHEKFGGHFTNDWHGDNTFIPVPDDDSAPVDRGLNVIYSYVTENLSKVEHALPDSPFKVSEGDHKMVVAVMPLIDPHRVLYNALVPFAVAALEHFFGQTFRTMLRYSSDAETKMMEVNRRVSLADVIDVSRGRRTVEDIVAAGYSFQSLDGIHKAFKEWFGIEFWGILRSDQTQELDQELLRIIVTRHEIVHRFAVDYELDRERYIALLHSVRAAIDAFIDHLEQSHGMNIREAYIWPD